MTLSDSNPDKRPLNQRLRREADEWDDGEPIAPLLIEAAEAIEHLAAKVAVLNDRDSWKRVALHYQTLLGDRGLL